LDKFALIIILSLIIAAPAGFYASAIDFSIIRLPGNTSNAILIQNSYGVNQFWIDEDGYVYANGTKMRINSITCAGTDKISAWNNVTGLFTCTTDSGGAGSDSHTNLGTGEASIALESVGSNHQFKTLEFDGSFSVTNYTNRILVNFTGAGVTTMESLTNVTSTGCATGQILKVSGTTWECAADNNTGSFDGDNVGLSDATVLIEGTTDFKRLKEGYGVQLVNNTNTIQVNSTIGTYSFITN